MSLASEILSKVAPSRRGFKTWFEALPDDARQELEEVRRQFNPAVHQKNAFARAVMEAAHERGWKTSGIQGVIAWLTGRRG